MRFEKVNDGLEWLATKLAPSRVAIRETEEVIHHARSEQQLSGRAGAAS
jgi:hypothetical protein